MAKGYWIAHLDVTHLDNYERYRSLNGIAYAKFGGRFLVRAGTFTNPLGTARSRTVVIEFPTYQTALDCWSSTEYQTARAELKGGAEIDFVIAEGYDGPQPQ